MGFSFSSTRRKQVNRESPEVQRILANAERYGYNRGLGSEYMAFSHLLRAFSYALGRDIADDEVDLLAGRLARETTDTVYPIAVDSAWMTALVLPNHMVSSMTREMGMQKMVLLATVFTDEFPGRVLEPDLGHVRGCEPASAL